MTNKIIPGLQGLIDDATGAFRDIRTGDVDYLLPVFTQDPVTHEVTRLVVPDGSTLDLSHVATDAASAIAASAAAEAARDAALLSRGVFATTAKALSKGVASIATLVGRFVVAGGIVTSVTLSASYASAPAISFAASAGLTGASATAVIANNVDPGEYFSVPSASSNEYLILYQNVAGVATDTGKHYPSIAAVTAISDKKFTDLFLNNLVTEKYYGASGTLPVSTVSGTTVTAVTVSGEPAVQFVGRMSDGGAAVKYDFPGFSSPSGKTSVGARILSSTAGSGASRFTTVFRDSAGTALDTKIENSGFSGLVTPTDYFFTYDTPVGTVRVELTITAYGSASNPRTTIFNRAIVSDGTSTSFVPTHSATTRVGYISPTGASSNIGTRASPLSSLASAIAAVGGEGTVIALSGDYLPVNFNINTDYINIKNLEIAGEARDLTDKMPMIKCGTKLAGITLESGKVYKADATAAVITATPNWIFEDGVPEIGTLVPAGERHSLLRGRAYRLPFTRILKTTATTLAPAIAEIQAASIPKCFYNAATKVMYFSIASGGDATAANIYIAAGTYKSFGPQATSYGTYGKLSLKNHASDLCYMHDNFDDGESAHENCVSAAKSCISEYNGSSGFIPASGGHGVYTHCTSRKNGQITAAQAGFMVSGGPAAGDDGVDTTAGCYGCISIGDPTGFKAAVGSDRSLTAVGCTATDSTTYGYDGVRAIDCGYGGTGTTKNAATTTVVTAAALI